MNTWSDSPTGRPVHPRGGTSATLDEPMPMTAADGGLGSSYEPVIADIAGIAEPSAGFVTGGGWVDSPANGKANFGFVARYKNGAMLPTGSTEFQFHEGGLNFHSTSHDRLLVEDDAAHYKGSGMPNGQAAPNGQPYEFEVWAEDGSPDMFRIRIWWESSGNETDVYDGGLSPLSGGSIVLH